MGWTQTERRRAGLCLHYECITCSKKVEHLQMGEVTSIVSMSIRTWIDFVIARVQWATAQQSKPCRHKGQKWRRAACRQVSTAGWSRSKLPVAAEDFWIHKISVYMTESAQVMTGCTNNHIDEPSTTSLQRTCTLCHVMPDKEHTEKPTNGSKVRSVA